MRGERPSVTLPTAPPKYLTYFLDSTCGYVSEWVTNQHRDTYASHVAHYDQLSYYAVAQNQSIGRARLEFLQKMIQPCGP
jgi:Splicing factor 3B subunit 10 (SF3b10)